MNTETKTLYRPVGPKELELIAATGYRRFPSPLTGSADFYPVLNEEYARQIAQVWNVPASGAGYVVHCAPCCYQRAKQNLHAQRTIGIGQTAEMVPGRTLWANY